MSLIAIVVHVCSTLIFIAGFASGATLLGFAGSLALEVGYAALSGGSKH